jgi:5-methylthioadenosine/S-adenosylhomocysteine deaminase
MAEPRPLIIRNGWIVSVDDAIGEIEGGDILVRGDRIEAVGLGIEVAGAEVIDATGMVVMPGMVNSHIHTWEIALRGIGSDWVGSRDYFGTLHGNLTHRFEAEDNYVCNLVGALNQINFGTTTIFDWCHNLRYPEMTDASIDGLEASGIRAVFGHGTSKPLNQPKDEKPYYEIPQPREEVHRLRTGRLASDDRLVTMALAILGPDWSPYEVTVADVLLAREYGLINSAHTYGRAGKRMAPDGMWRLNAAGLLGPDHNVVHGNCLPEDELKMIVEAGCSTSATCMAEMLNCEQAALLGKVERYGGAPAIGTDVDPYFTSSMLAETRRCFLFQRELDNREALVAGQYPPKGHKTTTRSALRWATINGAKALRLDQRIGSLTPGKQADIVLINASDMNLFPAVPLGDPVHAVVVNAETSNVDTVLIAGRVMKRGGRLTFPAAELAKLNQRLLGVRERVMARGNYRYAPVPEVPRVS